jgi:DNA-binding NarL/FixJ family response regulator
MNGPTAPTAVPEERTAVLLDPFPLWHDAVELVLTRLGFTVRAKTTSAAEALRLVGELEPQLFIAGLEKLEGDVDVLACIQRARQRVRDLKVIVLSMYDDPAHIEAALSAGANAYVVKTVHPDDLAAAIRQAFAHSVYLAGAPVAGAAAATTRAAAADSPELTRREVEILQLVSEGYSNAQLAKMLWVTEQTVKFHLSNIYRKLDVANRTEASRWAQVRGLLPATSAVAGAA